MFRSNNSTTNEFKRLLLTKEALVKIKPGNSSARPNEANRKTYSQVTKIHTKLTMNEKDLNLWINFLIFLS